MGKPLLYGESAVRRDGARPELKHLSRDRKRNHRDSVSKQRAKAEQPKPRRKAMGLRGPPQAIDRG